MKEYIQRLKSGCPVGVYALWWLFRLLLIYAFVAGLRNGYESAVTPVLMLLSFISTFSWELSMAAPAKSFLRFIPSSTHTALISLVFAQAFGGIFMNLSYGTAWFNPLMQIVFSVASVFIGYELSWAVVKKQRIPATKAMMFFVGFGFAFFAINFVELFEFGVDQLVGSATGIPYNLQHWSHALAEVTPSLNAVIPSIDPSRWGLMATMTDIVLGTASAFAALLVINIYLYRQKGRFRHKTDFEAILVAEVLPKEVNSAKEWFAEYWQRLISSCPKRTYILWWVIRLFMIGLAIYAFIVEPAGSILPIEILMNLAVMFIWELAMASPSKNVFRYIPPVLQTIITVGDCIAVCAGYIFNFYYEVRLWDSGLHFLCGILGVYFGYEITCALVKMERRKASLTMMILASVGFCFMVTTFWEIFEFTSDQVVGMLSGAPSDVQHWSYDLAYGTPKFHTLFEYFDNGRWALMDTMGDIVLNTEGTLLATAALIIYPYRHKGRFKFKEVCRDEVNTVNQKGTA